MIMSPMTTTALNLATASTSRRRALALLAASRGGAMARPFRSLTVADLAGHRRFAGSEGDGAIEGLRRALEGDATRRLGQDYLDATRDPADPAAILARVLEAAEPDERVGEYLLRIIAEDYEAQRTHDLDGWLVSRTEARLLAVLALTA